MHLFLFFSPEKQFRNAKQVDEIISTKLSTANDDPDGTLIDMVASVMVYGLCSKFNSKAKCMILDPVTNHKKCCKGFSKLFQLEIIICDDGYLLYCCRNNDIEYDILHLLYDGQIYCVINE